MLDKHSLTSVFDNNAEAYHKYRPKCPVYILDKLRSASAPSTEARILEIGCGTGQLTTDIAKWQHPIVAIEKGTQLAALAAVNTRTFPQVQVITASFEDWPGVEEGFDLVVACQSFHWIEDSIGIQKVYDHLKPNGCFALIWHLDTSQKTPFWQKSSPIYRSFFPNSSSHKPLTSQADKYHQLLTESKLFKNLQRYEYPWEITYNKAAYLGLLSTFSLQGSLPLPMQQKFFHEIGSLIEKEGGSVTRYQNSVMLVVEKAVA
ncbi:MAG: methyltransferase domain-containing protein [Saprospiraceae bacterium]|nr:methyltransferase domain-containing protein [Saprospiraceae bacterium]